MSEECSHDCSSCAESCNERKDGFAEELNKKSKVKKVIAVMSGKGGVGKSLVTSLLACEMQKNGYRCAIMDADITGPSIPNAFDIHTKALASEDGIMPEISKTGIKIMSLNLLTDNETDPVVWRGPMIAGVVKQFWTDVVWGDIDYMFVDMPPGTSDVPLTVFQSLPIDGIVVVTSPQRLVSMIVEKAVNMANIMKIPVLGVVENMSYFICPQCGGKHHIFGESDIKKTAEHFNIATVAEMPIDPELTQKCDTGKIEEASAEMLEDIIKKLI